MEVVDANGKHIGIVNKVDGDQGRRPITNAQASRSHRWADRIDELPLRAHAWPK